MSLPDLSNPSLRRFELVKDYLEQDPDNLHLLDEAAHLAYDLGDTEAAGRLVLKAEALGCFSLRLKGLKGLMAMRQNKFAEAAAVFEDLHKSASKDFGISYNLAWCRSMLGDFKGVVALLDDKDLMVNPEACHLKIRALHHLGELELALDLGARLIPFLTDKKRVWGLLSVIALDSRLFELADTYANLARDNQDGLSSLGFIALHRGDIEGGLERFEAALAINPDHPRGLMGKGLVLLAQGKPDEAAWFLQTGAEILKRHLGSWIAAAWAYCLTENYETSRKIFMTALEIDANFSESHGGLAVLDILQNQILSARKHMQIALRLNPQSLSGVLAKNLLLAYDGKALSAELGIKAALKTLLLEQSTDLIKTLLNLQPAINLSGTKT